MDTYTLAPSLLTKGEFSLSVPLLTPEGHESRGALLARALRGRYAQEVRCFYLTPSRARKWETLYKSGFTARQRRIATDVTVWRFVRPDTGGDLVLARALNRAILGSAPVVEAEFAS